MNELRILVAGIGNVFRGDDGVGVEIARRLAGRHPGVRVEDFGIRGFDLALALLETWELVVLVDAVRRGGAPGTVYLLEAETGPAGPASFDAHGMDPAQVLRNVRAMGGTPGRVLVVGVEPQDFGDPETGRMGLSPAVEAAVAEAVALVASLLKGSPAHA